MNTIRKLPNFIEEYPIVPDVVVNSYNGKVSVATITTSLSSHLIQKPCPRNRADRTKINKYLINPQSVSKYKEIYVEKLIYILRKHNPDFVAYGEYAFPFEGNRKKNDLFFNKLHKISKDFGVYILAGSYQDIKESNYNVTLLFVPWQKEPIKFIKWMCATNDGETTDCPNRNEMQVVQSPFGYFTSLACIDISDENFIKKVIFFNALKETISLNFFFNPSRDKSGESAKRAKSASYRMGSYGIHINDPQLGKTYVYFNSKSIKASDTDNKYKDPIYLYKLDLSEIGSNTFGYRTEVDDCE